MNLVERACPVCGETIKAVAKKCKHCGEWLQPNEQIEPVHSVTPTRSVPPTEIKNNRARRRPSRISDSEVAELLSSLVSRCLVAFDETTGRYRLLETVRQYSRDRLVEAGGSETWRDRHLSHFLEVAEEADPQLTGAYQQEWMLRLETEHENLRGALEWSETSAPETALRLAAVLGMFWFRGSQLTEGRAQLERALLHPGAQERTLARARALLGVSWFAALRRDFEEAQCWAEEGLEIAEQINEAAWVAALLNSLGSIADSQADYQVGREYYERSLAVSRRQQDVAGIAISLGNLGQIARSLGNLTEAELYYEESLALGRQVHDAHAVGWALGNLGLIKIRQAKYDMANELFRESLAIVEAIGSTFEMLDVIQAFGFLAAAHAQWERAVRLFGAAATLKEAIGSSPEPYEQEDYRRDLAAARTSLGEDAFDAAWAEGRELTLEQAIELALSQGAGNA